MRRLGSLMAMSTDEMVSALFDLSTLDSTERRFVNRMVNQIGGYAPAEEVEIKRLYRIKLGYLQRIKGRLIDEQ